MHERRRQVPGWFLQSCFPESMHSSGDRSGEARGGWIDPVKGQVFFKRELEERISWLITLRWMIGSAALGACLFGELTGFDLPWVPLGTISLCVLVYNGLFLISAWKLLSLETGRIEHFTIFAHIQISLDLIALFFAIYFTGGIDSPLLILPTSTSFSRAFC